MTNFTQIPAQKLIRIGIISSVALIHIFLLLFLQFNLKSEAAAALEDAKVIKLVDFQEYIPPPPPPKPEVPPQKIQVSDQPSASETVIAVDEEIEVVPDLTPVAQYIEPVYLPQHKISKIPELPNGEIQKRIIYPPMALRQNLEAVVYVELYIDSSGLVRRAVILKDPGHGFAEAAVQALEGIQCIPAEANGTPVAVRYRYPIRFVLN